MSLRCFAALLLVSSAVCAQSWTQRGYFETRNFFYPLTGTNDSGHVVSEEALRYEATYKAASWLRFSGSLEARTDSHRQVERELRLDWQDRSLERPALSARRFSAIVSKGGLTLEAGRQFVRWGKADLLNPTDRFAPRDFLNPFSSDFLGILAVRATYERGRNTFDAVWSPLFTPSRAPLLNQRWAGIPEEAQQIPIQDLGLRIPGRGQAGARWNYLGDGYEFSVSGFDGFNHLPLFDARLNLLPTPRVALQRYFPRLQQVGADAAVPLRWFTVKGEAGFYRDPDKQNDDFLIYVVQLERQSGEWLFVGGYAGEWVAERRLEFGFVPDRGLARTFLGRASYNLDANRTVTVDGAIRQNADGGYARLEYTQAFGAHWRATAAFTLLAGRDGDFLGQYRRNSGFGLTLRYSF